MPESRSCALHHLLGNADELAILAGLSLLPLRRGHPLEGLHPPPCRPRAIAKTLDPPIDHGRQPPDQASDHTHDVPQQGVVGRMMNVGLHDRRVDTQLLAILQPEGDAACTTSSLRAASVSGVSWTKPRWN